MVKSAKKKISSRERTRRMFLKMYISFEKKLSEINKIWWNGLSLKARYSLLHKWVLYKNIKKSMNRRARVNKFISINKPSYRLQKDLYRISIIDNITTNDNY